MRLLITGAGGLLGSHLHALVPDAIARDHASLDITDGEAVANVIERERPEVITHCAAMTNVDQCEQEPERAYQVNAAGSENIASECARAGVYLIAVSTDYVFDGKLGDTLAEDSPTRPISEYGRSKLAGENAVRRLLPNAAIVRTSWVYGEGRRGFVGLVRDRLAAGEPLTVSSDQCSSPTWAADLAIALLRVAEKRASGTFHLCGEGAVSRDEWARSIAALTGGDESLITSVDHFPAPAPRPEFSAMTNTRAKALGIVLPPWRSSLERFLTAGNHAGD